MKLKVLLLSALFLIIGNSVHANTATIVGSDLVFNFPISDFQFCPIDSLWTYAFNVNDLANQDVPYYYNGSVFDLTPGSFHLTDVDTSSGFDIAINYQYLVDTLGVGGQINMNWVCAGNNQFYIPGTSTSTPSGSVLSASEVVETMLGPVIINTTSIADMMIVNYWGIWLVVGLVMIFIMMINKIFYNKKNNYNTGLNSLYHRNKSIRRFRDRLKKKR